MLTTGATSGTGLATVLSIHAYLRTGSLPFQSASPSELELKENEIVAIMGKLNPSIGAEVNPRIEVDTDWQKARTRDGREGGS